MTIGVLVNPRPALAVSFMACLAWVVLCAQGVLDAAPLPPEVKVLIGVAIPVVGVSALLYRADLFSELRRARRIVNVLGLALALLVTSFGLLLTLTVILFAFGVIAPP